MITKSEIENIGVKILWGIGFFFVALILRDWISETFGNTTALIIAVIVIVIIAYKYKVGLPYNIRR